MNLNYIIEKIKEYMKSGVNISGRITLDSKNNLVINKEPVADYVVRIIKPIKPIKPVKPIIEKSIKSQKPKVKKVKKS